MADLTFSTTLLGQFLEDMEAYAEVSCGNKKSTFFFKSFLQIIEGKEKNVFVCFFVCLGSGPRGGE